MDQLLEIGVFTGKAIVIVLSFGIILALIASAAMKSKPGEDSFELTHLNKKWDHYKNTLQAALLAKKDLKKQNKKKKKSAKKSPEKKPRLFVLDFKGDIKASRTDQFRNEISAVLSAAEKHDEVVVTVESPGGMVHGYGLAASQLLRIKSAGFKLTICVDKVAASGGYMMACTADKIVAAPFAILGSIGVLAQIPNFNKFLKKHDIDYQEITAGEYKRTLTMFGEVTDRGKEKFKEQMEDTHHLFKEFVSQNRPQLDMDKIATGEYWFGSRALSLGLVDELKTSDEYLMNQSDDFEIYKVEVAIKKKLGEKIAEAVSTGVETAMAQLSQRYF